MPWKQNGPGEFEFNGPMRDWLNLIGAWANEDQSNDSSIEHSLYLNGIVAAYIGCAKDKWAKEWFGKKKIAALDSRLGTDAQGHMAGFNFLDALDYLSENLDDATY